MDARTLIYLTSLGVIEPFCQNCLSENFNHFTVLGRGVISCDQCNANLKGDPARDNTQDLISDPSEPIISETSKTHEELL